MSRVQRIFFCLLTIVCRLFIAIEAWQACTPDEGGGICPDLNYCCRTSFALDSSSCISSNEQPHNGTGTCCGNHGTTGCGPNYSCSSDGRTCILNRDAKSEQPDMIPSYQLCALPKRSSQQLRSISIEPDAPQLAYYSTTDITNNPDIRIVLIVIHGSGRNADDYLCCGVSSVPSFMRSSTLVIAPMFLAHDDGMMPTPVQLLRWNETDPIPHTWRYGADAVYSNISSYQAIDVLIETLIDRIPSVERVIVAGHSAGGQFTQRWALTSGSKLWKTQVPIRVVAANPRSFCYLDGRRFLNRTFRIPDESKTARCPGYNHWEWGLEQGGRLPTPYFDRAIEQVGGIQRMVQRYGYRDVIYVSGELDTLHVSSECESDHFQGPNRRARSHLFFQSLKEIYGRDQMYHLRLIAKGIPHDHCLIFQSSAGQRALYGEGRWRQLFINLEYPPS